MENRLNIYSFPHKGLRNGLGKLSLKAGSINFNDKQELQELANLTDEISELLDLHLHSEEDYVLPPLEEKVPGSTQDNHEDHQHMERLEREMVDLAHSLNEKPSAKAAAQFYDHVNLFIKEYFRHMDEEEKQMNAVIWKHFTDEQILGWQGQILSQFTPEQFFKWFKYIIPSLHPEEQSIMLGGFKANAPKDAFEQTITGLKPYLSNSQYEHIQTV